MTQQGLAARLGISASYLNLIEHDQRAVTAQLLIKFTRVFDISVEALSGSDEHRLEAQLREALCDPAVTGRADVPAHEIAVLAAQPAAAEAVLMLHQAVRAARHDADVMQLPGGRRIILPQDEVRHLYENRANFFAELEQRADEIRDALARDLNLPGGGYLPAAETNHAVATRLRQHHGIIVRVTILEGALRQYDPSSRTLLLSDMMARESRGFQMCFQLVLLEARDVIDTIVAQAKPTTEEARTMMRIGLANYTAACLLMPYEPFLEMAAALRHDIDCLAARFGVSFHQAAHRLGSLQKPGARGVPFYFVRMDAAGNITKSFSACSFPILKQGNPCPRWNACTSFSTPGLIRTEIAKFADGSTYLTFARTVTGVPGGWHDPAPVHVIAMGCPVERASEVVYADRLELEAEPSRIGVSCHLCDWTECRSRAFPPLNHRLAPSLDRRGAAPFSFVEE